MFFVAVKEMARSWSSVCIYIFGQSQDRGKEQALSNSWDIGLGIWEIVSALDTL